jgi:ElaB/YqjD/DUF883 family membrane-anchored ribosome-binding protein
MAFRPTQQRALRRWPWPPLPGTVSSAAQIALSQPDQERPDPMSTDTVTPIIDRAAAAADSVTHQAANAAQRGVAALHDTSQRLLDRAHHAQESTVTYIRDEPVKAMLMAAAAGATLMALVGLLTRSRSR